MSKRIQISDVAQDEGDPDLRRLLEGYLRRSEELEEREGRVLKQIELMQSAVTSLRSWNEARKPSVSSEDSVHVDIKQIEEETKLINEETKRIQMEIEEKIKENEKLEKEIQRRKTLKSVISEAPAPPSASKRSKKAAPGSEPTETRNPTKPETENKTDPAYNLSVDFFDEKLRKLKEIEKKFKKESDWKTEEAKKRQQALREKIELLEWDTQMNKKLIDTLKKTSENKKNN